MIKIRLFVLFAILSFASVARADFGMGMFNAANSAGMNIAGTAAINAAIGKSTKNAASSSTARQNSSATIYPETLEYSPSPEISAKLRKRFWNTIKQNNPQSAEEIDTTLRHQDVIGTFKIDMAPYELRADNVGDTVTAYWLTMWLVANQASTPSKNLVKAVQNQVSKIVLQNELISNKNDAQKQVVAETLIYETMLALGMHHRALQSGNPLQLQELSDAAYTNMLKQNIDLRSLDLTPQGFTTK
ncbi:hypothetical protein Xen7305DRAFT_00050340 [Xenococcus sp. PCC 7305]|uniref:DUF6683 family protein n=1 Tax=Xenococcus sp. PCC 7305 TaxID=102125 RepID=UPI0002ABA4D4|nr:DUF6683 family protein [Xenococcus sp. PCC 7305]ELS05291.1 hypothetical protein Xen7305DRAFT_00050340 [Xenococcus sp. PCC 7305]